MLSTLLSIGAPTDLNSWGERSTSEYLLLKRSFGTYTRIVSATGSRHFQELEIILGLFCYIICIIDKKVVPLRHKIENVYEKDY